jgi:carbonic anhydrase/acetyltransferase-like protein (isoleucine patch superfamily)
MKSRPGCTRCLLSPPPTVFASHNDTIYSGHQKRNSAFLPNRPRLSSMSASTSVPPPSSTESHPRATPSAPAPSAAVPGSKPPLEIHPAAHFDPQAYVQGTYPITLGANVIVHPRARLVSVHGPLTIGAGTVISERCIIGGPALDSKARLPPPPEVPLQTTIGQNVVFHASAEVQAGASLDDACLVESRVVIKKGVRVGKHSKICAGCIVDRSVGDWAVVWGEWQQRRIRIGAAEPEGGRLKALEREREATVGLLRVAAAKATLGKRRG